MIERTVSNRPALTFARGPARSAGGSLFRLQKIAPQWPAREALRAGQEETIIQIIPRMPPDHPSSIPALVLRLHV